ncbi:hypothetical protein BDZ85DRAFT_116763 [Elsinoe ampelina]|uniref:Uncharacterized protein n=1 Tax=Elsinoe ampelina TaxID=302913 RepID=A0A6A6FXQ9_9PEZI|nr:hypothetical protein BDZ85DRAFT_116763 [Elsinoe ampelina]
MADERHSTGFTLVSMWLLLLRSEPTEPPLNGRRDLLIGIALCTRAVVQLLRVADDIWPHSRRIHPSIDELPLATHPILQVILRWMPAKAEMAEGDPFLTQRMIDTDAASVPARRGKHRLFFPLRRIYADLMSLFGMLVRPRMAWHAQACVSLARTSRNAFLSPSNTSGCGIKTAPD